MREHTAAERAIRGYRPAGQAEGTVSRHPADIVKDQVNVDVDGSELARDLRPRNVEIADNGAGLPAHRCGRQWLHKERARS
jgi:hypothetical protein